MRHFIVIALLGVAAVSLADEHGDVLLEIGLRSSCFELRDSRRGAGRHYLGSLDELIEETDYLPLPFVNIRFGSYWALGLGYDAFRIKTWSRSDSGGGEIGHSDGTIDVSGPSVSAQFCLPNRTRYTPFVEASLLLYNTSFDHLDSWRNARGDANSHVLDIHDENGFRLGLGCAISLAKDWSLVLTAERTYLEVDAIYYLYGRLADTTTFPLDNTRYGIGVKYRL
ncbi:MAG: hypothetical protein QGH42_03710 [Kiritimatiellia bacterium]|jgi:hypothetical protein|nr:hypothetical protein [Kiritimatiellia bacterium]MDP6811423.1 hypothetical protein [Kiritimatiellia bacterium]MDP7023341.1 hypothetical protein [Kiritimatiellia bacterium]